MSMLSDPNYLRNEQYRDSRNLNARMALHERFSTNPEDWHLWVFKQFEFSPDSRLLELGCGPGSLWLKNLNRLSKAWKLTLSDFSPGMLDEAWRNLHTSGKNFQFEVIDAQNIPYPDSYFDGVVANHMLYHVPDRSKALSEIHRVLKPGGKFYAATNGIQHMQEIDQLVAKVEPDMVANLQKLNANQFTLENGAEQLAAHFATVIMRPYEDSLQVTDAEPLVAYVLSMSRHAFQGLHEEKKPALERLIQKEVSKKKGFHITKSTGLFIATKADA